MEISTVIIIIIVPGIVWGGLAFILSRAVKYENQKKANGEK